MPILHILLRNIFLDQEPHDKFVILEFRKIHFMNENMSESELINTQYTK